MNGLTRIRGFMNRDEHFGETMRKKSNAIMEAKWLKAAGDLDSAMRAYTMAATLEYQVYGCLKAEGLFSDALASLISCASCYYHAGKLGAAERAAWEALDLCEDDQELRGECMNLLVRIERHAMRKATAAAVSSADGPGAVGDTELGILGSIEDVMRRMSTYLAQALPQAQARSLNDAVSRCVSAIRARTGEAGMRRPDVARTGYRLEDESSRPFEEHYTGIEGRLSSEGNDLQEIEDTIMPNWRSRFQH